MLRDRLKVSIIGTSILEGYSSVEMFFGWLFTVEERFQSLRTNQLQLRLQRNAVTISRSEEIFKKNFSRYLVEKKENKKNDLIP